MSSPRAARTLAPSAARAAATSSCADSGLAEHSHGLGSAGAHGANQRGGLGRDVHAGRDAQALERALEGEPLPDLAQDRHLALGPGDPGLAVGGEARVGYLGRSHAARLPTA